MIVGFPAGGASDVAARSIAGKMSEVLGQPIVVENKPGAASNIGSEFVAKSKPDGYTVLFGTISLAINGSLYKNLTYDPIKDFIAVSQLSSAPFLLVVNPLSTIKSVHELIEAAKQDKAKGKSIDYATAGNGSGSHLFMELFTSLAGIELSHIPYRGAAPAMADVLGGQVPMTFDNIITTLQLVEAGKLRPLAVSSIKRSSVAPDIPTLEESGVKGYDATSWFGLFVPANTPNDIVLKLSQSAKEAVNDPDVSKILRKSGADPAWSSSDAFTKFYASETVKWSGVIKGANVTID
jgi:tripartite-type tricarboxylate transporter receptor subunit TctC